MQTNKRILLASLLVMFLVCFLQPTTTAANDWPMFRQNLNHTGTTAADNTYNSSKLLWTYTTDAAIYSSPAAVNGCVYVGSRDHNIYCFNASNGEKLWNFSTGAEIIASPTLYRDFVYLSSNDGWFYCLNASTGMPVWIEWLGWNANSCAAVLDGYVYVGSGNHDVVCFNASDGAELWRYVTKDWVLSSPAVTDGVVYVATNDFYLHAINASTGKPLWVFAAGVADCSPAIYNGSVYIGSYSGYMYCFDAQTGAVKWQYETPDSIMSSPAISDGCVFFGCQDNNLYCLNTTTGELVWCSAAGYWVCSSPAVVGDCVYVGSEDNGIYCFNVSTGQKLWVYQTGNQVVSSPAISDGRLFVGSYDHILYAFTLCNSSNTLNSPNVSPQLSYTTVLFDLFACLVTAIIVYLIANYARMVWQERKLSKTLPPESKWDWLLRHTNAMCLLFILGFAVACYLNLENGVLWAADEQTYSQMAYYITRTGDYLNPHCFGHLAIWTGKPPLLMWLMSLSYQMFGITDFAARFFLPLFGVAALVFVYFLGKKLYNRTVGFLSVVVLGTFSTFYMFATHAMIDVPLTCFMLASFYFFLLSQDAKSPMRYAVLSGIFFGLAFLAKQTSALLIPAIIFAYLVLSQKSLRPLFTKRVALFLAAGVLLVAPWLVYMSFTYGFDFWNCYFLYSTMSRFSGAIEGHAESYFYYFNYMLNSEMLVWVFLLPFAVGASAYFAYKRSNADILLVCWVAVVLLVFLVAQTKIYYYILPAFPAFALALGGLFYRVGGWLLRHKNKSE